MHEAHHAANETYQLSAERTAACDRFRRECADLQGEISQSNDVLTYAEQSDVATWAVEQFPDLDPKELLIAACQAFEAEEREFDASYSILDDDPAFVRADIELLMRQMTKTQRNGKTEQQIDDGVPDKVPDRIGKESSLFETEQHLKTDHAGLAADHAAAQSENDGERVINREAEGRRDELKRLQGEFEQLRGSGISTVEALRAVATTAENPETQRHLNSLLQRVSLLNAALPEKPGLVTSVLDRAGLDLTADTVSASFAGFTTALDADDRFSDNDKAKLRQIIAGTDRDIQTGSQVYETALATVTDPETGNQVSLYTEANKAEVRPGVYTYTETGRNVMLELNQGSLHQKVDVTGLDGASVGTITEILTLAASAHKLGADGFIQHVYGVDVRGFGNQPFDPISMNAMRQKLTHLMGARHDGEIFSPDQQAKLIERQIRAVSPTGELLAWEDDPERYRQRVQELGLDTTEGLEEFGRMVRLTV